MSRTAAKKQMKGEDLERELETQGVTLAASQRKLLSEEACYAYKDVSGWLRASCRGTNSW